AVDFPGLHNKLRTEYGPASVRPHEVASVLQDIQRDLEDYEAEIYHLERLRQEKQRLEQYAAQMRSLFSPIRKVPDEIICHIFDDCCDMNSFRVVGLTRRLPTPMSQALRSKPAMVISSVCSRWRRNALSMPVIWSRISLLWNMHLTEEYCEREHTEVFFPLSNFLDLSQQCPMTVNLEVEGWPFATPAVLHPVFERLFLQAVRWQNFSFRCVEYTIQELLDFAGISPAAFPVLSELCVTYVDENDLIPFLDTAPKLQSLSLGDNLDCMPQGFKYYLQLSHLDFCPDQAEIQNLFDKCPNLVSLRVPESWHLPNAVGSMTITCSSRLETLIIRHGHWWNDVSDAIFPLLRLPSLKTLRLEKSQRRVHNEGIDGKPWNNFEPFKVFVHRSTFQLTTFSMQQLTISDANLVYILFHLPTLQDLTIDDSGISPKCSPISSEFIESLHGYRTSSLRPSKAVNLPRLRSLRLLNVAATTFSDHLVVDMVQSRWIPAKIHDVGTSTLEADCLRVFTMTFPNRSESEAGGVYSSLAPIERDGMMVVIGLGRGSKQ
ncbi:hypothetical protein BDP27DRAFT_1354837, partial [Rhodocollybia butyracea]